MRRLDCSPTRIFRLKFAAGLLMAAAGLMLLPASVQAQGGPDYEQPPIRYSASTPQDAVARLQEQVAKGELRFTGTDTEILHTLLRALEVPVASQVVVFSKTSLQRNRIRPQQPRALYFSDSAYVGWVPGGLMELVTIDPQLGPIFYSFDPQTARTAAKFVRDADCLRCHGDMFVRGIPAVFARSVFPADTGELLLRHGSTVVDDRTPFETRWGGWYVTGYKGTLGHRGNGFASEEGERLVFAESEKRPMELGGFFNAQEYPCNTSDVVALLVFEHQMAVQNSLTRAMLSTRKMIAYQQGLQQTFKEPITEEPAYDSVKSVFASSVDDVVDRLLFRDEAPLPEGVVGSAAFREGFARNAPRSAAGHSLKDLSLRGHIFTNRCSYLIHSESFHRLPASLKTRILSRLHDVLRGREPNPRYAYLPAEEKERIFGILRETHADARAQWAE